MGLTAILPLLSCQMHATGSCNVEGYTPYFALLRVVLACQRHYDHDIAALAKQCLSTLSHNIRVSPDGTVLTELAALLVRLGTQRHPCVYSIVSPRGFASATVPCLVVPVGG